MTPRGDGAEPAGEMRRSPALGVIIGELSKAAPKAPATVPLI